MALVNTVKVDIEIKKGFSVCCNFFITIPSENKVDNRLLLRLNCDYRINLYR